MVALAAAWSLAPASAQTLSFEQIRSFGFPGLAARLPDFGVIEGTNGVLYGLTGRGGSDDFGTVFQVNKDGTGYAVLHSFSAAEDDGHYPSGALVDGGDGALYGTTSSGGTNGVGTVFKLNTSGTGYQILHTFGNGDDGQLAYGALIAASDGALYGTTFLGGINNAGTVYKLNKNGSGYDIVLHFGASGQDARNPYAGLIEGTNGALFGTTWQGGTNANGTVYRLDKDGDNYSILRHLSALSGGITCRAPLKQGTDGRLFGTAQEGGSAGLGTLFRLNTNGSTFTVLHHFGSTADDGQRPQCALIEGPDGALYGTTPDGGDGFSKGTVFKISKGGAGYTVLKQFTVAFADGVSPRAGLILGSDTNLYGTASTGGINDAGTVFKLSLDAGSFSVLLRFQSTGGDGQFPRAPLSEASDGAFYGTTESGGANGDGTVFKVNADGTGYMLLRSFNNSAGEGRTPMAGLFEGSDGALYGTTDAGGSNNAGTVFKLNKDGSGYAVLLPFSAFSLVEGSDHALYGTRAGSGGTNFGTVFKVQANGTGYTNLHSFNSSSDDGRTPAAGLLAGSYGVLYGTTYRGGSNGVGTVFRLNEDGTGYTLLRHFRNTGGDGQNPNGLAAGFDGTLYGATFNGGAHGYGSIFKLNPDGSAYTNLYSFASTNFDGLNPTGAPVEWFDGALYGTTTLGGSNNVGTIFKLNRTGTNYTTLRHFSNASSNSYYPRARLLRGSDASLYGTTLNGGSLAIGTVYRLAYAGRPLFGVQPASAFLLSNDTNSLNVVSSGPGVLAYQWFFNSAPVGGAVGPTFQLASNALDQAGQYWVVVSNSYGSATSAVSTLSYFQFQFSNNVPALIIAGATGAVYRIDYRNELTNAWQSLTNFTLTNTPQRVEDSVIPGVNSRFYRAAFLP